MRRFLAIFALSFALPAYAEKLMVCMPRVPCPLLTDKMYTVYPNSPVPFDCPVKFHGLGSHGTWIWAKAGEPSRPCGPLEFGRDGTTYQWACSRKIGDPIFVSPPLMVVPE